MAQRVGFDSADELVRAAVPTAIRLDTPLELRGLRGGLDEAEALDRIAALADRNDTTVASLIGMGYYGTRTPAVIRRGVLENPSWYTAYTPYQPEISQGRLEALLNYQTMVCDLVAMEIANSSLLCEGTAAAEAMAMARRVTRGGPDRFFVDADCHPQVIDVVRTRAAPLGIDVTVGRPADWLTADLLAADPQGGFYGALLAYPGSSGAVRDLRPFAQALSSVGACTAVTTDLLACCVLTPPGEMGADIVVGSSQRFGVPLGFGGPHAAFLATRQAWQRSMPGRLVGVSRDTAGRRACRLALQTREQHIRREKATSNICTAQVLLAVVASMYAVWHGPRGLRAIARRVHRLAAAAARSIDETPGVRRVNATFFDTITVAAAPERCSAIIEAALAGGLNLRRVDDSTVAMSFDETCDEATVETVLEAFRLGTDLSSSHIRRTLAASADDTTAEAADPDGSHIRRALAAGIDDTAAEAADPDGSHAARPPDADADADDTTARADDSARPTAPSAGRRDAAASLDDAASHDDAASLDDLGIPEDSRRTTEFLMHPTFEAYRTETQMMRYLQRLARRDIALDRSMIPLGSCTMKLNAAAEMTPITWPQFADLHPFVPAHQSAGYRQIVSDLERWLCDATGYDAVSLQPNAGSAGELAGLLAIRRYYDTRGETQRTVCLIPESAHGTNAASAVMAGMSVHAVSCGDDGDVDLADLAEKTVRHGDRLAAAMVTYPSTHGVFEAGIGTLCDLVHSVGAQVYLDGANLNALVGLAAPGRFGADVSHLNLHKTFCIPHGGGGPGVGPVAVRSHLAPYLPNHPLEPAAGPATGVGAISSAPWGSAGILAIPWMYLTMMGAAGLTQATKTAIVSANYVAARLAEHFDVLYRGPGGLVAHECIVDLRPFARWASIEDVAKRLIDYGFHAPTMSFPVAGTLMIEPTESESLSEIDRFCDAMACIRAEIAKVASGEWPIDDNPLRNAPHTASAVTADDWAHPYSRAVAAFGSGAGAAAGIDAPDKYWPPVGRIDGAYGDRNVICSCPPMAAYAVSEPAAAS